MSELLQVGHGNVHNQLGPALLLARRGLHSIGLNEAHRIIPELRNRPGYWLHAAGPVEDPRSRETPMLLNRQRKLKPLGEVSMMLSPESTPIRVAPERWATVVMYLHPKIGPVAHTNVHLHWIGPAHDRPEVDRVQAYDQGAEQLRRLLLWQKRARFARVCTGDVNVPKDRTSPRWTTAWEAFTAAGMESRGRGLDGIAWGPELLDLFDLEVIEREEFGSDHPALIGSFKAAA